MKKFIKATSEDDFLFKVCEFIFIKSQECIQLKDSFSIALTGGETPKKIFQALVSNYALKINWSKVHFYWIDERCVPPSHEKSNYKSAYELLISKLDKFGSINRIKGELNPDLARMEYENVVEHIDFSLLGMGNDGHVGSIFPNSEELRLNQQKIVRTKKKYFGEFRISFSINQINKSDFKLLLITSKEKIKILKIKNVKLPIHLINNLNVIYYLN